jgi:hypothetical protein
MPIYTWINDPPIEEIPLAKAAEAVRSFQESLRPIAAGVGVYGEFTATKAGAAIDIAGGINQYKTPLALSLGARKKRVFGYKLDGLWVGLIHIDIWEDCVYIDHVVGHAGTENAGDILIEHVLQFSPKKPPVAELFAATEQAFKAYRKIGFEEKSSGAKSGGMKLDLGSEYGGKFWTQSNGRYKLSSAVALGYLTNQRADSASATPGSPGGTDGAGK